MPINPPVYRQGLLDAPYGVTPLSHTKRTVSQFAMSAGANLGSGSVPLDAVPNFDLSRFVWLNGTKVFVYSPVSAKIVDQPAGANLFRQYLMIRNDDAADTLFVDFGQSASALSGVSLLPGEIIAYDAVVPQDDVYVFGAIGGNVSVLYGNITIPGA